MAIEVTTEKAKEYRDINLDNIGRHSREIARNDRDRKAEVLTSADRLINEIIQARIANQEFGLSIIRGQIESLTRQRSFLLEGPMPRNEILELARDIVQINKQEALAHLLIEPLAKAKMTNTFPFENLPRNFPEEKIWMLFFLAISDEDIEKSVLQLPDVGLSQEERQAKAKEIASEIERLTALLQEELEKEENLNIERMEKA